MKNSFHSWELDLKNTRVVEIFADHREAWRREEKRIVEAYSRLDPRCCRGDRLPKGQGGETGSVQGGAEGQGGGANQRGGREGGDAR